MTENVIYNMIYDADNIKQSKYISISREVLSVHYYKLLGKNLSRSAPITTELIHSYLLDRFENHIININHDKKTIIISKGNS
ncbi:MAG: hypothetical protein R2685_02810 [Candidatus Nitrosocosmicus sp.]|nr:hypothetical protein [Candidatus Nitrosocosmicus sp.]